MAFVVAPFVREQRNCRWLEPVVLHRDVTDIRDKIIAVSREVVLSLRVVVDSDRKRFLIFQIPFGIYPKLHLNGSGTQSGEKRFLQGIATSATKSETP